MGRHIKKPAIVEAAGNKPKIIEEFIGNVNSGNPEISIARMQSPAGWIEPPQTPEFDEYTLVLSGSLFVICANEEFVVRENEAFIAEKGKTYQYSTPHEGGASYVAVCLPAFHPDLVHREA
jgi:mannose-6-phosphate isomerase-like protein (cupin superfamily)